MPGLRQLGNYLGAERPLPAEILRDFDRKVFISAGWGPALSLVAGHLELHSADRDAKSLGDSGSVLWVTLVEDLDLSLLDVDISTLESAHDVANQVGSVLV